VKWAQYAAFLERILFCLKPEHDRGVAPALPRKSAIKATYVTIDYDGREYRIFYEEAGGGIPMVCLHTAGSDSRFIVSWNESGGSAARTRTERRRTGPNRCERRRRLAMARLIACASPAM
jgi:hypothetical protein